MATTKALSFEDGVKAMPKAVFDQIISDYKYRADAADTTVVRDGYLKLIDQFEAARYAQDPQERASAFWGIQDEHNPDGDRYL